MNPTGKRRGVVVVNFGDHEETADVKIDGEEDRDVEISAAFEKDRTGRLPARLTIPPQRCAVLVTK
jgi:hypothetical protein